MRLSRLIRFVDRPFAVSVLIFGVGALTGFLVSSLLPPLQYVMIALLRVRVLEPVSSAEVFGSGAVLTLIFVNNAVPVLLSFLYPALLASLQFKPPLTDHKRGLLLTGYSVLAAFLLGFLDLGASLGSVLFTRGASLVIYLLSHSWLHAPIEFTFVVAGVSEPARIALRKYDFQLFPFRRRDGVLLLVCLVGLLLSGTIEYAFNL